MKSNRKSAVTHKETETTQGKDVSISSIFSWIAILITLTMVMYGIYLSFIAIITAFGGNVGKIEDAVTSRIPGSNHIVGKWEFQKEFSVNVREGMLQSKCLEIEPGKYKVIPKGQYLYSPWHEKGGRASAQVINYSGMHLPAVMGSVRQAIKHRFGNDISRFAKRKFSAMVLRTMTSEGRLTEWQFIRDENHFTGKGFCVGFNVPQEGEIARKTIEGVPSVDALTIEVYRKIDP